MGPKNLLKKLELQNELKDRGIFPEGKIISFQKLFDELFDKASKGDEKALKEAVSMFKQKISEEEIDIEYRDFLIDRYIQRKNEILKHHENPKMFEAICEYFMVLYKLPGQNTGENKTDLLLFQNQYLKDKKTKNIKEMEEKGDFLIKLIRFNEEAGIKNSFDFLNGTAIIFTHAGILTREKATKAKSDDELVSHNIHSENLAMVAAYIFIKWGHDLELAENAIIQVTKGNNIYNIWKSLTLKFEEEGDIRKAQEIKKYTNT